MTNIIKFTDVTRSDVNLVGGKNAYLGDMIKHLSATAVKVPPGFAITTNAYQLFLQENELGTKILNELEKLNIENLDDLKSTSDKIREWVLTANLPISAINDITENYNNLSKDEYQVAVRSSATAEDLPDASFAGQQETILNVSNLADLLNAIKRVYASLFTERSIAYRTHHGIDHKNVFISVGIQRMIRSDLGASGVAFTMDTESGFDQVVFITGIYGLGEMIVQGKTNPDEFYVHKPSLRQGHASIVNRKLGNKNIKMIYGDDTENVKIVDVPAQDRQRYCLTDEDVINLAKYAIAIEDFYKMPMDIEWAKDGVDGEIYIVQARPETVKSRESKNIIEQYKLLEKGPLLTTGNSVGQRIGQGCAKVILNPHDKHLIKPGDVLVTDSTDPDWEPIMKKAAGIVTNHGGRTCHAAIIARELGIPAVVGCEDATEVIKSNDTITLSCAEGEVGNIYQGMLKFEVNKTKIDEMPKIPVKICMNIANPEQAFSLQAIPNEGVGLARIEFIISNIGVHPNAIIQYDTLPEILKDEVKKISSAYSSPTEFYIEKLSEGIATIGAAFYPKPVIVRFSDFKSNEYAHLLGGDLFEPKEENPMIGYRGAYRYITDKFRECFALECEAIKRIRNQKGLTNVHIMVPFVRTIKEAQAVIDLLQSYGLSRGENNLLIYMMCEIPSNVILAEEFLALFDGFSIGSNDLTQLTLGVDRDSEQVAPSFDERNEAVKKLLHHAIDTCKKAKKYVGICGQGPSDHTDFAKWLLEEGIESISLNPDTVVKTWLALSQLVDGKN